MMDNITIADFGRGSLNIMTAPLWQYDYGQVLKFVGTPPLPDAYEVLFSNDKEGGEATTQIGDADGVHIPDMYLTTGKAIFAWLFLHSGEDDGETVLRVMIPINRRSAASDAPPTPVEQSVITQTIAALNVAVEKAEDAQEKAEDAQAKAEDAETGAEAEALKAEGFAVGQQNGTDVPSGSPYYHNSAKYFKEEAADSATAAGNAEAGAEAEALKAEGFAVGQQNGTDVSSGSPYYHNNAKYYMDQTLAALSDLGLSVVDGAINVTYTE